VYFEAQFQDEIGPLIGLEYLIVLQDEPFFPFICSLCSEGGDYSTITSHFKSSDHKIKFMVSDLDLKAMTYELLVSKCLLIARAFFIGVRCVA
jgi:hypothetical protein